jgi:hypothetical protein
MPLPFKKNKFFMRKKGSILLVSSWVLSLLVIFALSSGYRAQIALKLSRYQRGGLETSCLMTAGINRAIYELEKDVNSYDTLSESWSDNEKVFSKISPQENKKEFCTVSYIDGKGNEVFGVMDEQSKIDINNSDSRVIEELFNLKGFNADAKEFSKIFREWISSSVEAQEEKKIFKNSPLSAKEELLVVLEYFYKDKPKAREVYESVENLITVYGGGKSNINTVSEDALLILSKAYAETEEEKNAAPRLAEDLIKIREEGFLKEMNGITFDAGFDLDELSLWNKISAFLDVKSDYFRINAQVVAKDTLKQVSAVFNRDAKEIIYWHQF